MLSLALVYGFVNSVILALVALGFNLTFGISGVANFAYGAFFILSGLLAWVFFNSLGLPYILAVIVAVVLTAIAGALMYRFVLLRIRGMVLSEVIATFGIGLALLELFKYMGFIGFEYSLPVFVDESLEIGPVIIDMQRIFIVVIGIAMAGFLRSDRSLSICNAFSLWSLASQWPVFYGFLPITPVPACALEGLHRMNAPL
jgi:branched-chain amino acid transport system permease protein